MAKIDKNMLVLDFDEGGHKHDDAPDALRYTLHQALMTIKNHCASTFHCHKCPMEVECVEIRTKSGVPENWYVREALCLKEE